jgi:replicative DNA helicase
MIEELIFSQLLTNDQYARTVIPHLKDEYFSTQEEKSFYKIYSRFFSKHNKIPSKQAMILELSGLKSSADLYSTMITMVNRTVEFEETLPYLIEKTESWCKERAIFNALRESVLIVDGQSKDKTAEAIPSILQAALAVCFDTSVGHNYIEDAMSRYEYYHHTEARIRCGIPIIDKITKGGFPRKTLNVLLSPPHGGKSLVLVNIAAGAVKLGSNVLYLTLEMAAEEIGRRFDVNLLDVDFDTLELLSKNVFESKFAKMSSASRGKLVIKEFPTGAASAAHFRALLSELKTKQNFVPDMIVIDYMNICASEYFKTGSSHNSYIIIGSVGKELRALGIEFDAAVVTATQTNRSGVNASDVDMTAVSDSAGTSMISDFMMAIINTDELKQLKQLMFKQLKNRYSGTSDYEKFILGVDYTKMKVYELDSGSTVPTSEKRKPKIETANDSFGIDMNHQIKNTTSFDDFNFGDD